MAKGRRTKSPGTVLRALIFGGAVALVACGGEPAPVLSTAPAAAERGPRRGNEDSSQPQSLSKGAGLWFSDGPGLRAMVARQRGDHDGARTALDELLAQGSLSTADRAAAQMLRALEAIETRDFEDAAEWLSQSRASPSMRVLDARLRVMEAQARLDAGDPERALSLVRDLDPSPGVPAKVLLVRADGLSRTGDPKAAISFYRRFLVDHASGHKGQEVRIKMARLLVKRDEIESRIEAGELFERLAKEVPLSDYGREAALAVQGLLDSKVLKRSKAQRKQVAIEGELATIEALLARRRYKATIDGVDGYLAKKRLGIPARERCRALYAKGSAVFKQRRRADARAVFSRSAKVCAEAGTTDLVVKSSYQAARGLYAAGHYSGAAKAFESLAHTFSTHTYADDALIKAAEAWEQADERKKARLVLRRSLTRHPHGDMAGEARRRLLLQAFREGRHQDAEQLASEGLASGNIHGDSLAKLHYFRGRALIALGRAEEGQLEFLETIRVRPLSYPSLLALSRLKEQGRAALNTGISILRERPSESTPSLELPAGESGQRIKLLARLGLGREARAELRAAAVAGWPAVAILDRAGLWTEAQKYLANMGSAWRSQTPVGDQQQLWKLAHPRPYLDIIEPGEVAREVPDLLTYAIMQTESRFNPGAVSWAGARGLVQLMPATAKGLAKKLGVDLVPGSLHQPAINLRLGMAYLARLSRRFGGSDGSVALAIPSYNAGAGAVDRWLSARGDWDFDLFIESIPFDETRKYTQSVLGRWMVYRWLYQGEEGLPYLPMVIPQRV